MTPVELIQFLETSRQVWRRFAYQLEQSQRMLRRPGDQPEIIEDDAGDLFAVVYGVHDYPVEITLFRGTINPAWRTVAHKIAGDVRTTKRPARA